MKGRELTKRALNALVLSLALVGVVGASTEVASLSLPSGVSTFLRGDGSFGAAIGSNTVTFNVPVLNLDHAMNNAGAPASALLAGNLTDTASLATSVNVGALLDLKVGGTSKHTIGKDGSVTTATPFSAAHWSAERTAAKPTIDTSLSNEWTITLANGANAFATFSNGAPGQKITLRLIQPSSGSAGTVTWPGQVRWSGGTAPTLTATNSKTDYVIFRFNGTNWDGFTGGLNY